MDANRKFRVAVVGAGFIANAHFDALRCLKDLVDVVAVCDRDRAKSEEAKRAWGLPHAFTDAEEMLRTVQVDAVHVLVPPMLHAEVAEPFLRKGIHVFLEKPMCRSTDEADRLNEAAEAGKAKLGVNHNAVHFPIFYRLQKDLASNRLGRIQGLQSALSLPFRQLTAGDFGNWVFAHPKNILFELAYHHFSQYRMLLGKAKRVDATPLGRRRISATREFFDTWLLNAECEKGNAQFYFSVGREYPTVTMQVICQDGVANLDFVNDSYVRRGRTKYAAFMDSFKIVRGMAGQLRRGAWKNLAAFAFSTLKLRPKSDAFFTGIRNSIRGFYTAIRDQKPLPVDGRMGRDVLEFCEMASRVVDFPVAADPVVTHRAPADGDTLVLGGTGFIGKHLVDALRRDGHKVRILARKPQSLPEALRDPEIAVVPGDVNDRESVFRACKGARYVYHLAVQVCQTWEDWQRTMTSAARNIADACLEAKVERLFYASTSAVCYLGGTDPVYEDTPSDPKIEERQFYARAKVECEKLLLQYHKDRNLNVFIVRPAVVVGKGGMANHGATGTWNSDTHCIGWGRGRTPLPFVLVEDVADAFAKAARAPKLELRTMNLVGDVRLTAREWCREVAKASGRLITFHPQPMWKGQMIEIFKWMVKKLIRKPNSPFPSYRDLNTRSMRAPFDCTRTKEALGWKPCADRETFVRRGVLACVDPEAAEKAEGASGRDAAGHGGTRPQDAVVSARG